MMSVLKNNVLLFLTISVLMFAQFFSCKKKEINPDVQESQVIFYFKGMVDDAPLILEAGKNDYYMYSDIIYDYTFSSYIFSGKFSSENSSKNSQSLEINIIDADSSSPTSYSSHISSFIPGDYNYYYLDSFNNIINSYLLRVFPVSSASPIVASYQYSINNNFVSNAPNFTYTLTTGNYSLTQVFYNIFDSCSSVLTNTFYLSPTDSFYAYFRYTAYTYSALPTVTFTLFSNMPTSYTYTFDFGDGSNTVTTNTYLVHSYQPYQNYSPTFISKSNNGKEWVFKNNLNFNNINCSGNYYYKISPLTTSKIPPYSKIIINYTDENRILYKSNLYYQPATSYFKIESISEYKLNEKNQKTKMIVANLKVRVFSTANPNDFKDISGKAVFAVAYF